MSWNRPGQSVWLDHYATLPHQRPVLHPPPPTFSLRQQRRTQSLGNPLLQSISTTDGKMRENWYCEWTWQVKWEDTLMMILTLDPLSLCGPASKTPWEGRNALVILSTWVGGSYWTAKEKKGFLWKRKRSFIIFLCVIVVIHLVLLSLAASDQSPGLVQQISALW